MEQQEHAEGMEKEEIEFVDVKVETIAGTDAENTVSNILGTEQGLIFADR